MNRGARRVRNRHELNRCRELLALARALAEVADAALPAEEGLARGLALVGRALGFPVGHVYLLPEGANVLVTSPIWYLADPDRFGPFRAATDATWFPPGEGLPGRVLATGEPVQVETFRAVAGAPEAAAGLRVGYALPLRVQGVVTGILEFYSTDPDAFDAAGREPLPQVALALARICERRRASDREAFCRSVIDHVGDPIFVKDRACRWVMLNRALEALVGYPRETMLGKSDYDFFPREQADFFRAKDLEMFHSQGAVAIEEEPITDANGRLHVLATTKVPMRAPGGDVTHLVGVIHDITGLKAAQRDLQERNQQLAEEVRERTAALERLDAVNRDLEGFCHSVSHDLRTPLRAIDGFSRLLVEEANDCLDDNARRSIERVRANVRRMSALIDDILALSRVSRRPLRSEPIELGQLAWTVVEELRAGEPDRVVELAITPDLHAEGDPELLSLLLENLLGNAWKFTGRTAGARIELGREHERFYVRDNGAGFDMAHAALLFKPFSRLHRATDFPGTGIGLATAERIVTRHGGRLWADGAVGRGATFWFTLPAGHVPA